jgi:hypothetical protein
VGVLTALERFKALFFLDLAADVKVSWLQSAVFDELLIFFVFQNPFILKRVLVESVGALALVLLVSPLAIIFERMSSGLAALMLGTFFETSGFVAKCFD